MEKIALHQCATLLIDQKLTIAFAESATAGRLAAEFSLVKDAGKFLKGGLICYDAYLKEDLLAVPHELIEKYTPESAEVTKAITRGLQKLIEADLHIGVTGLPAAGGSETAEKPVGTMFICGMHNGTEIFNKRITFDGNPEEIIVKTVSHTATMLISYLKKFN
ncbi:MAG: CinA family protein [Chitinophagaceae bacterium]|nr:MAG: CinA family protein [Chitinophagaceae bacterium]